MTTLTSKAPLALLTLCTPADLTVRAWTSAMGMTLKEASAVVAGLSSPGKMPCHSYGLPAAECSTGSRLRAADERRVAEGKDAVSVCGDCYALKNSYTMYPEVIPAQYRRLQTVRTALEDEDSRERWIRAMVTLIGWHSRDSRVFRWHDSGDLQSVSHLELICSVCEMLPWVSFWIPTREFKIVTSYLTLHGSLPANLNVRQSAMLVGHLPNPERASEGRTFSGVATPGQDVPSTLHSCPARFQDNECGSCRACWDREVPVVIYPLH
jgi:hypothetical protein